MTPQEREMLIALANKIAQTPPPQRDSEAEDLIRNRIGSRPDALYILTQTVLIQNLALDQAQRQIRDLQQRGSQVQGQGSSFLGSSPMASPTPSTGQQPPPGYASAAPSAPSTGFGSGSGSSFLRGAATTAAGVAAGALAFEGIRALFGGSEHPGGFGTHEGSFLSGAVPASETIINNYYESPQEVADENSGESSDSGDDDTSDQDAIDDSDAVDDDSSDDVDDGSSDDFV